MKAQLLFLWLALAVGVVSQAATAQPLPDQADLAVEAALLQHTNAERASHGLPPLVMDEALARAARMHAQEMAELGYLAHESPRPERASVAQRLNIAGAIVQGIGENLALLSGVADIAAAAVSGWMDSPGHRANLLGEFTHVGFGVARSAGGATYVAQVFGLKDIEIVHVEAARSLLQVYDLHIDYTLAGPREVAFWIGEQVQLPGVVSPGQGRFSIELREPTLVHISSGTRPSGSAEEAVFISADSGWFEPGTGEWLPTVGAISETLRIDSVSGSNQVREFVLVEVQLAATPQGKFGVWLDGSWLTDHELQGQTLIIRVPAQPRVQELRVGVEDTLGSGIYNIVLQLEVLLGPEVRIRNPGS